MVDGDPGGTDWEKIELNGTLASGDSAAHGWATLPTAALSQYVLGAMPTSGGFQSFSVMPQPGGLFWAEGRVPTPTGSVDVAWGRTGAASKPTSFQIQVTAPPDTAGRIAVPLSGSAGVISEDGRVVWDGNHPLTGEHATSDGAYVYFDQVTGTHQWTWDTRAAAKTR